MHTSSFTGRFLLAKVLFFLLLESKTAYLKLMKRWGEFGRNSVASLKSLNEKSVREKVCGIWSVGGVTC